jgi:hypothetical protein
MDWILGLLATYSRTHCSQLHVITSNTALSLYRSDPTENTVSMVMVQQFFDCCLRILCCVNLFTEPLPSNERLLWLRYSGFQASCHNTQSQSCMCLWREYFLIYLYVSKSHFKRALYLKTIPNFIAVLNWIKILFSATMFWSSWLITGHRGLKICS